MHATLLDTRMWIKMKTMPLFMTKTYLMGVAAPWPAYTAVVHNRSTRAADRRPLPAHAELETIAMFTTSSDSAMKPEIGVPPRFVHGGADV